MHLDFSPLSYGIEALGPPLLMELQEVHERSMKVHGTELLRAAEAQHTQHAQLSAADEAARLLESQHTGWSTASRLASLVSVALQASTGGVALGSVLLLKEVSDLAGWTPHLVEGAAHFHPLAGQAARTIQAVATPLGALALLMLRPAGNLGQALLSSLQRVSALAQGVTALGSGCIQMRQQSLAAGREDRLASQRLTDATVRHLCYAIESASTACQRLQATAKLLQSPVIRWPRSV